MSPLAGSDARCAVGAPCARAAGAAIAAALQSRSSKAAAWCGTHSRQGDAVPVARINGCGPHASNAASRRYIKIGTKRETVDCRPSGHLLSRTIFLAPYDSAWSRQFSLHAQHIRDALSEKVLLLEHVGSTSVPGLSAKPIIDMVLAVSNSADEPSYVPLLEARGFVLTIREPDWFEHRLLKAPDIAGNLHVFSVGCEEIGRMLNSPRKPGRTHSTTRMRNRK